MPNNLNLENPSLLLIANFLSESGGRRSVMEDMAEKFREARYSFITASHYNSGLSRGAHMVATTLLRRRKYDVSLVDVYSGRAFFWAEGVCCALGVSGKPFILTLRGGNLPAFAQRWPRRVARLLKSAAVVTTPSRFLLEQMKPYCKDLLMLPNPLNVGGYDFKLRTHPRPRLIWLRSFHSMYNPELAIRVAAELAREYPDLQLTMVGPDKGDGSLQQTIKLAAELGVAERVEMPGGVYKKDVAAWMNQGDIFLNTTNIDNAPVSVLEAMACGLCVVSTNVGGVPYLLKREHDAMLVPPDDPEAMAAAVRRLLTNPSLAGKLSRNGRETVEQFDWSIILPQWETLMTAAAAEAGAA